MSDVPYILIVDDDWMNRELLETYLKPTGYRIGQATSGEQALAMAVGERPDVVMLDVRLTGIDGFEVCRRLKQDPRTAAAAVLMITALQSESDQQAAILVGADGFITKPYHAPDLLARIAALVERDR